MINANLMYLRPGNLYKDFIIERNVQGVSESGRPSNNYMGDGTEKLKGCLAEASTETKERWGQLGHMVSHTIVQTGRPKAKEGDRLVLGNRYFHVEGIDDAGGLGVVVMYYVSEQYFV